MAGHGGGCSCAEGNKKKLIEGLMLLAWVLDHRRYRKQPSYCDCTLCKERNSAEIRSRLGCGYMPPSKRSEFSAPSAWQDISTGICPGWLITLPQVLETARLYPWWERGQLRDRIEGQPSALLCDALDVLQAEMNACEAHAMERASDSKARR